MTSIAPMYPCMWAEVTDLSVNPGAAMETPYRPWSKPPGQTQGSLCANCQKVWSAAAKSHSSASAALAPRDDDDKTAEKFPVEGKVEKIEKVPENECKNDKEKLIAQ